MKKVWNVIKTVFTWALVLAAVAMMIFTIVSVSTFDRNDRDLFGFKAYIVRTDSMASVNGNEELGYFEAGDLILVKEVDPNTLVPGDIITFTSTNSESYGETVAHMIREKALDPNGEPGFITYGTSTGDSDEAVVTYPYVLGKYQFAVPFIGTFFSFLKTTPGYIICILLPFLALIIIQVINTVRLMKQYKKEQMEAIEADRAAEHAKLQAELDQIAAQRKESEELMKQLLALKQSMGVEDKDLPKSEPSTAEWEVEQSKDKDEIKFDVP